MLFSRFDYVLGNREVTSMAGNDKRGSVVAIPAVEARTVKYEVHWSVGNLVWIGR